MSIEWTVALCGVAILLAVIARYLLWDDDGYWRGKP